MVIDLRTEYLGLTLTGPIIAAASPCTGQPDVLRRLESFGASAAVLPSLFEEQVGRNMEGSAFPHLADYNRGPDNYARLIEEARSAVSIPIFASLNAVTPNGLSSHIRRFVDAGASGIELNLYFVPTNTSEPASQVEAQYLDIIAAYRSQTDVPLSLKIGPYFTSVPYFASRAIEAGANGLVFFNRYLAPEIDLESGRVEPYLRLSSPDELRLTLRWLAILRPQLASTSLAATGGIHSGLDVLKALATGANVVMIASALLHHGAEYLETIQSEMISWLENHDFTAVRQILGSLCRHSDSAPSAFERANYAATLGSYLDVGPQAT